MCKTVRFILFFLLFGWSQAVAQPTHLLNRPFSEKSVYCNALQDTMYNALPYENSAARIQSLVRWAANNDDDLYVLFQLIKCRLEADHQRSLSDSLIKVILRLQKKYGKSSKYLEATIFQCTGDFYYEKLKKNSIAFEQYLCAYSIYKGLTPDEFPQKQRYLYALAGTYFRYDDFRNAIKFFNEALATKQAKFEKVISMYNTIGMCYQKMKIYDSSLLYFKLAMEKSVDAHEEVWGGIISGNIGITYYQQGRYSEAVPLLKQNIDISVRNKERKNALSSIYLLTDIYLRLKDTKLAEETIQKASQIDTDGHFSRDYSLTAQKFKMRSKLFAARGDMKLAYMYSDSESWAKDLFHDEEMENNLTKAREKEEYVARKFEAERIESERFRQVLIRNSLICLTILLSVISILFINRQRLKQKKMAAEFRTAEAELNEATAKLINFRQMAEEKDELIGQLKKTEKEQDNAEARAQLENSVLLTDEQWDNFRRLFEKVHKGFFIKLNKKIPDLTATEERFLALVKLNLSAKEMAAMLGVSPNTIRNYKYRLRKKMNVSEEFVIEDLVKDI